MSSAQLNFRVNKPENTIRIVFVHHSTGRNLIQQGEVRELMQTQASRTAMHYEFWDQDYNKIGLSDASGSKLGITLNMPGDNTDPDGLEALFSQPIHTPPDNALSALLTFDVVIFKSCYPVSAIHNEEQLERYKQHYLRIRETMLANPQTFFVVMTPPPLIPKPFPVFPGSSTTPEEARRAREFANWLTSGEFIAELSNVAVFDFFDYLAAPDDSSKQANMLRAEYRSLLGFDSHPNSTANKAVAPLFVDFIVSSVEKWCAGR